MLTIRKGNFSYNLRILLLEIIKKGFPNSNATFSPLGAHTNNRPLSIYVHVPIVTPKVPKVQKVMLHGRTRLNKGTLTKSYLNMVHFNNSFRNIRMFISMEQLNINA